MKTAVYARFSSSLQKPTSIDDQIALCRQAAPRLGCEISDEHIFTDVEISGAVAQRPSYQRLLQAAARGDFQAIIVEAQDRLWRSQAEMHRALDEFRFAGTRVFSVETGADLTEEAGHLVASLKGLMDEAFLRSLREKTRRGMLGQVRRGFSPGGHPYGYRSVQVDGGWRRVVDMHEAKVVLRIFTLYVEGLSPVAIAKRLNGDGVPPPRWRAGRPNRGWTPSSIHGQRKLALGILNNPIYVGRQVWNRTRKVRNPHTGRRVWRAKPEAEWVITALPELRIIPDELWNAAQERRQAMTQRQHAGPPPRHLLSGLLQCGLCGASYSIIGGRGRYGCTGHHYRGMCENTLVAQRALLEERVVDLVRTEMLNPAAVARLVRKVDEALTRLAHRPAPDLRASRRAAEVEVENLTLAIRSGGGDIPKLVQVLREATERAERLQARLQTPKAAGLDLRAFPTLVEGYLANLEALLRTDVARARELLRRFLAPVILQPKGDVLVAVVRGNVAGILPGGNLSAGRGI